MSVMSTYSKKSTKTNKTYKSNKSTRTSRTTRTNLTTKTSKSLKSKLLAEIKSKYGVHGERKAWNIDWSLLQRIQAPNPFNKLLSKHDQFSSELQSALCVTLSSCLETIVEHNTDNDAESNPISSVEIFALFLTLLRSSKPNSNSKSGDREQPAPHKAMCLVILLSYLIPALPSAVLLASFDSLAQHLGNFLYAHELHGDDAQCIAVQYYAHCASGMLQQRIRHFRQQQPHSPQQAIAVTWSNEFAQKLVQSLLVLCVDDANAVRRVALREMDKMVQLCCSGSASGGMLPSVLKNLLRCFVERQIDALLNGRGNGDVRRKRKQNKNAGDDGDDGDDDDDKNMNGEDDGGEDGKDAKTKNKALVDLNVIAFICELLMQSLQYLSLKEVSYLVSIVFNVVSFYMQTYGDQTFQFKNLNLQQMLLKLLDKFVRSLPQRFGNIRNQKNASNAPTETEPETETESDKNNNTNIDELAKQLNDKIDLKQLVLAMNREHAQDTNLDADNDNDTYVRFIVQIFDVIRKLKPRNTDVVGVPIYYACLVSVLRTLHSLNQSEARNRAITIVTIILAGFDSNKKKIVDTAQQCVVQILEVLVNDALLRETQIALDPMSPASSSFSSSSSNKKKLPVLQRILILIESLLDFKYKNCWMYVYMLCEQVFRIFGENGFFLLGNVLTELSELRCMKQVLYKAHLEAAIAAAIRFCGVEHVLGIIPLNLPTVDTLRLITMDKAILKSNLWLLPLLRANVSRANLSFFGTKLLPIADQMMQQSAMATNQKLTVHHKQFDAMSHHIWSLFPAFCIYPRDFTDVFPKIAESVAFYMMNLPDIRLYIINGLSHLIEKPINFLHKQEQREAAKVNTEHVENATAQLECMTTFCQHFLPILCNILIQTENHKRHKILKLITLFARISDATFVETFVKRTLVKFLEDDTKLLTLRKEILEYHQNAENENKMENDDGNQSETDAVKFMEEQDDDEEQDGNTQKKQDKEQAEADFLDTMKVKYETLLNQETAYLLILNEMVAFMQQSQLETFWAFLKQQFSKKDQSALIEKLLYKNLFSVLNWNECVLIKNDEKMLRNFLEFINACRKKKICIGATVWRLQAIHTLLDCLAEYDLQQSESMVPPESESELEMPVNQSETQTALFMSAYPDFIGELIGNVALSNLKIKRAALSIVELIALRLDDIDSAHFNSFMLKLCGGLISETPAMQSASITTLSYLLVQFEMRIDPKNLNQILKTISLRIERPSAAVMKASLDLMQIVIREMPDQFLNENLMDLLTTLLKWLNEDAKSKFKVKITKCIDALLKRFGYERILKLVPNRFQRLIKYLRKRADYMLNKREQRKEQQKEEKRLQKKLHAEMDELPPDHPMNVREHGENNAEHVESESESEDEAAKMTEFERMKSERMSARSGKTSGTARGKRGSGGGGSDAQSMRMRVDGARDITDLSENMSVRKQLVSDFELQKMKTSETKQKRNQSDARDRSGGGKKKNQDHVYQADDGRIIVTDSDSDDDHRRHKQKQWKNLSDDEEHSENNDDIDDWSGDEAAIDDDVDDVLSNFSKFNKMVQLKKALSAVSTSTRKTAGKNSEAATLKSDREFVTKRRKILDSMKNDAWTPGELQPYGYHMISPALLSRKKQHLKHSTFDQVMGRKRGMVVRTDSAHSNALKISRTRKVGHGRYTLNRAKIKAKQKHLLQDIKSKLKQKQMRAASKKKMKGKKFRGIKRRRNEM